MKYVKIFIYIIYLIVYGYSTYKTTAEPENNIWGYICALVFGILAIMWAGDYSKKTKQENKS